MNNLDEFLRLVPCTNSTDSLNYLLVMPNFAANNNEQYIFPYGLAYISSALKASGRNVFTLNLNYKDKSLYDLLKEAIIAHNIDVLMTGALSAFYSSVYEILKTAKMIKPELITIVGGGLISGDPIPAMTALQYSDYGVIGEGEITVCELCNSFETKTTNVANIAGIIYKDDGHNFKITPVRPAIANIDILPWPDLEGFHYDEIFSRRPAENLTFDASKKRTAILLCNRGCPFNCTFCFHTTSRKYRKRSLDSFFEEFDYLVKRYSFDSFYFEDELFTADPEWVKGFCERIKPYGVNFSAVTRADMITEDMILLLKDAGCTLITFGIESLNNDVLKSMKKHITAEQIIDGIQLCLKNHMPFTGNLIFGDQIETFETAHTTLQTWRVLRKIVHIDTHWIIPYPGSDDYYYAIKNGYIKDPVQYLKDGCPQINFSKLSDADINKILQLIEEYTNERDLLTDATLNIKRAGAFPVYSILGICPYCGERIAVDGLQLIRKLSVYRCPSCDHNLNLYAIDYIDKLIFENNLTRFLENGPTAFWPAVNGINKLIDYSELMNSSMVFLVDSSIDKQGSFFSGKVVSAPDIIRAEKVKTVIVTATTNVSVSIVTYIRNNFDDGIQIVHLDEIFTEVQNGRD